MGNEHSGTEGLARQGQGPESTQTDASTRMQCARSGCPGTVTATAPCLIPSHLGHLVEILTVVM